MFVTETVRRRLCFDANEESEEVVKDTIGEDVEEIVNDKADEVLRETCEEDLLENCDEPVEETETVEDYYERLGEEALREALAEEDRVERENEERMREEREYNDLMFKIEYGIAEVEDFGRWKNETSWDFIFRR